MKPLTQQKLKQTLNYDPETGKFACKVSNGRIRAGDEAGNVNVYGYRVISIDGCRYQAHRLAWLWVYGEMPTEQLDHIDCDKLNNRIANLRQANHVQNGGNRARSKRNTSGYKGVSHHTRSGKWGAFIGNGQGSVKCLGYFDDKEQAAAAYRTAAIERFGAFARF